MELFTKTRPLPYPWTQVAKAVFRKFENDKKNFHEQIVGFESTDDYVEITKLKVATQEGLGYKFQKLFHRNPNTLAIVRYDLKNKVVTHWERFLDMPDPKKDEKEVLVYREVAPQKVEYTKHQWYSSKSSSWVVKAADMFGYKALLNKIKQVIKEEKSTK